MKLYFSPGACSLSPHIVLLEAGLPFSMEQVDLREQRTAAGQDYRTIHPAGLVPALMLEEGAILTEGPAIVQYLADQVPERELAPPAGTLARYRLMAMLNFIASELHKNYAPMFCSTASPDVKAAARYNLTQRCAYIEHTLQDNLYICGDRFSVADAYLFTVTSWAPLVGLDMQRLPRLAAYQQRIGQRPLVRHALRQEGLLD